MEITILQWNVWFKERADSIVSFVKGGDADIVCLQELTEDSYTNPGRNIREEIAALGYNYAYKVALQRTGENHIRMGNGIFSKFPIISRRDVYIQRETPGEGFDKENRIYIEVKIKTGGKALTVGTTHMSYIKRFGETSAKKAETDKLLRALAANKEKFILTGDLNAAPETYTIKNLKERFIAAGPNYHQKTWTTKPFEDDDFFEDKLNWRLDYVFTTADVKVLSSEIIKTNYSDHLPILTTIEV